MSEPATEVGTLNTPDNSITLIKCELKGTLLCQRGEPIVMSLADAMRRFAKPDPKSRANILHAKSGHYIGLLKIGKQIKNFLIVNRESNGDIAWILRDNPELSTLIQEVYLVKDIVIERNAVDMPSTGGVA